MNCPYCKKGVELVTGDVIYPRRPDLKSKKFWKCKHCDAYVGCHPNTDKPLGRLANSELRKWKSKAHEYFDPLWKDGKMSRQTAYYWLALALKIPVSEAHIGMFDVKQCKQTINIIKSGFIKG